jgi:hypothetical protein
LQEIANRVVAPSRTTGIIAAAMVSLGLIEQEGGRYRNSAAAAVFLAGQPGPDLRPMLRYYDIVSYPLWQKLGEAVRTGEDQARFLKFDQAQRQIYAAGVEAFSAPVAAALATTYDFSPHRRLLDVAGGTGSFLVGRAAALSGAEGHAV